jgi:hypothetical protein
MESISERFSWFEDCALFFSHKRKQFDAVSITYGIMAAILASLHIQAADDLFGTCKKADDFCVDSMPIQEC